MTPPKPTISMAILLLAFLAIALALLRFPTVLSAQVAMTAALTALLIATVGAIVGTPRAFWIGFAVAGWSYLILSLGPWCSENVAPWLISTRILDELYVRLIAPDRVFRGVGLRQARMSDGPAVDRQFDFDFQRIHVIGHALNAILHGVFGGVVGLILSRTRRPVEGFGP